MTNQSNGALYAAFVHISTKNAAACKLMRVITMCNFAWMSKTLTNRIYEVDGKQIRSGY